VASWVYVDVGVSPLRSLSLRGGWAHFTSACFEHLAHAIGSSRCASNVDQDSRSYGVKANPKGARKEETGKQKRENEKRGKEKRGNKGCQAATPPDDITVHVRLARAQ